MNDFIISLPIVHADEQPRVDVHYEWTQYALWLSGRYGFGNIDGHEIGLSPQLVHDLLMWTDVGDANFDSAYPPDSPEIPTFDDDGLELAKRVRAELPDEWVVTTFDPISRTKIVVPPSN